MGTFVVDQKVFVMTEKSFVVAIMEMDAVEWERNLED
jgi:hypothetical protein